MKLIAIVLLTSVSALRYQLVSRSRPDSFTRVSGPLYSISFLGWPTENSVEWTVSAWTFVVATGFTAHSFLTIAPPYQTIYFVSGKLVLYGEFNIQAPGIELPKGVWIHAIMGLKGGNFFGVVTLRDGTQYSATGVASENVNLLSDSEFSGSAVLDFTVRKM